MKLFSMDIRSLVMSHKKWREIHKKCYTKIIYTTSDDGRVKSVHCLEHNELLILKLETIGDSGREE